MATDYRRVSAGYRRYAFLLTILMGTLATTDRSLVSILGEGIKREYALSDSQLGMLAGLSFAIPLSLLIIPLGMLADRTNRARLVSGMLLLWSCVTALTGLTQSYLSMLGARVALGAAEAGAAPTLTALVSDIYPPQKRATALGWYYFSSPLGGTLGFLLGGFVAYHLGWRAAFVLIGAPGILLSVLAWLTLREPQKERELPQGLDGPRPSMSSWRALARLLRERRVLLYLLLAASSCVGAQAASSIFMAPYLIRVFGLNVGQAGLLVALSYGVGGMIGMPLGGIVADWVKERYPGRELAVFGIANMFVAAIATSAFLMPDWRLAGAMIALYAAGAVFYYGITYSVFVTQTPVGLRGGALAVLLLGTNLVGYGLGPQLAGLASDAAGLLHLSNPIRWGIICCLQLYAVGGIFHLLAGRALRRSSPPDEGAVPA